MHKVISSQDLRCYAPEVHEKEPQELVRQEHNFIWSSYPLRKDVTALERAVAAVVSGQSSLRAAEETYGVGRKALANHVKLYR